MFQRPNHSLVKLMTIVYEKLHYFHILQASCVLGMSGTLVNKKSKKIASVIHTSILATYFVGNFWHI
jgi:hypothetical protein